MRFNPSFLRITPLGVIFLTLFTLFGCASSGTQPQESMGPEAGGGWEEAPPVDSVPVEEKTRPLERPASTSSSWADSVLLTLTLREKAGQLMMPWVLADFAPEGSSGHLRITELVEEQGVGGIILSVGSPTEAAAKVNDLQRRAALPLLVAADLERGAGYRFNGAAYLPGAISLGGATEFPPLMAVGATGDEGLAREMGRITGREARALGIHTPFAPVLDVNNNPDNPIINIRSFGERPQDVARLGRAFIRGLKEEGLFATAKHFPGHGDTETDSHLDLPVIRVERARMDTMELVPFRAAVEEGIGGVMTAHLTVPELSPDDDLPATLSRAVLTDLLKEEMGFRGLVFTDAMDMFAIDRRYSRKEATVLALEAGADVILMPPDVEEAIQGVVEAVESGRVPEARLDESVLKILSAKEGLGLHREREVPLEEVSRRVGIPAHQALAQEVADHSITLLKNDRNLLPLLGTRSARVLSVSYRRPSDLMAGRVLNAGLRARYPRLVTAFLDQNTAASTYEALLRRARTSDLVVVSLYVTVVTSSGTVAIPDEVSDFIRTLGETGVSHIAISFGNPYLVTGFPDVQSYMLAWYGTEVSQRAAAKALFGEIPIQGRAPTMIPPAFGIGDGLQLPIRERRRDF